MKTEIQINQEVAITALSFRSRGGLTSFPKRMEFEGRTYMFKNGLQCLIRKGEEVIRIFDMTDGKGTYRLKCDEHQRGWTLLAISTE